MTEQQIFVRGAQNTDKIGVVSYFDSMANSKLFVYWPLDESSRR